MPQQPPENKVKREVRNEDRGAGLETRAEYAVASRAADFWRTTAMVLCMLAVLSAAGWGYKVAAQVAAQTPLLRPISAEQSQWLNEQYRRHAPLTVAEFDRWRPPGWAAKLPNAFLKCQARPSCARFVSAQRELISSTPEMQREAARTQSLTTGALVALLVSLIAARDVREWADWERAQLDAPTQRRLIIRDMQR